MPKILLVEDEQVNRDLFRRRLERKGYAVLTADGGLRAIELAKSDAPDLVLMDLALPDVDGWEATRRLKADPATAAIPVIALSAHATADARDRALAAGCREFETKPVNWDALFKKIDAALAARPKPADEVDIGTGNGGSGPDTLLLGKPAGEASNPTPDPSPDGGGEKPPPSLIPASSRDRNAEARSRSERSYQTEARDAGPTAKGDGGLGPSDHAACPVQPKYILVAEDNDANRVMLCRRLNKHGFATAEARDGREALARVNDRRFDLVLLDIMMPEVDGYTVLRELKADPDLQAIPVLMISAVDEMASVVKCIEMGAEDYLPKPYDPVLLHARINACLDKRRLRDQEMEYLRAVADLTQAAAAVERGEFDSAMLARVAARADALGRLARVFENMAREVRAREQKLNREVARLQVEVDRGRMTDQVKGITGTAYFEALEKKAAGLRSGRSGRLRAAEAPPSPDPNAETEIKLPQIPPPDPR
jgi:two-component system, cell cycle response regulator